MQRLQQQTAGVRGGGGDWCGVGDRVYNHHPSTSALISRGIRSTSTSAMDRQGGGDVQGFPPMGASLTPQKMMTQSQQQHPSGGMNGWGNAAAAQGYYTNKRVSNPTSVKYDHSSQFSVKSHAFLAATNVQPSPPPQSQAPWKRTVGTNNAQSSMNAASASQVQTHLLQRHEQQSQYTLHRQQTETGVVESRNSVATAAYRNQANGEANIRGLSSSGYFHTQKVSHNSSGHFVRQEFKQVVQPTAYNSGGESPATQLWSRSSTSSQVLVSTQSTPQKVPQVIMVIGGGGVRSAKQLSSSKETLGQEERKLEQSPVRKDIATSFVQQPQQKKIVSFHPITKLQTTLPVSAQLLQANVSEVRKRKLKSAEEEKLDQRRGVEGGEEDSSQYTKHRLDVRKRSDKEDISEVKATAVDDQKTVAVGMIATSIKQGGGNGAVSSSTRSSVVGGKNTATTKVGNVFVKTMLVYGEIIDEVQNLQLKQQQGGTVSGKQQVISKQQREGDVSSPRSKISCREISRVWRSPLLPVCHLTTEQLDEYSEVFAERFSSQKSHKK